MASPDEVKRRVASIINSQAAVFPGEVFRATSRWRAFPPHIQRHSNKYRKILVQCFCRQLEPGRV